MSPADPDGPREPLDAALDEHDETVRRRIGELIADSERVSRLVNIYYDKNNSPAFAGELFDAFGNNPPDVFTSDDVLAASLLDVQFGVDAVRTLLTDQVPGSWSYQSGRTSAAS